MPRKSWKPRGGPGCVAPAPAEFHWKALNPNPIPAKVPDNAFVDVVDVPAAIEDALLAEETVRKLVVIGMELSQEELCANDQMQEDKDESNDAVCPSCLFSFSTLCTSHRHVGKQCMSAEERIRMLEERLKSRQLGSDQNQIDEVRNLQAIMRDAKQCPRCKMAISKIEGCNKMTCSNCGHYLCYQCNFAIVGYDHFKRGACDMFSLEETNRWEAQVNPGRRTDAPAPVPLPKGRYPHPCPRCEKQILKIGNNNHITCGSCQTQFCALCRKTVQRTSEHFGPRGCKQHTADPD